MSCKHGVEKLHRPVAARGVLAALEAVNVELPDEGAQVVVLEVEWQYILRVGGGGSGGVGVRRLLHGFGGGRVGFGGGWRVLVTAPGRCARR